MTKFTPSFQFDNSYFRDLEGFYAAWQGTQFPAPAILRLNKPLARELGLNPEALDTPEGAAILSGKTAPEGAAPLAMAYAGHQFGGFSPQLGDGRALLLGEVIDQSGKRQDIHLKGSGRTPFSRGGDGKAVLGPVLREYLIGEAMHALGIPTTRALAAVTTGEEVMRERPEQGAVLARVASSHLRVGTFQFFAARSETAKLRQLADYAIVRHFPDIPDDSDRYLEFFRRVRDAQADLVAKWVLVGFVHGVMNTDNMTISGETIDYGPCAFIDTYDPKAVFSSIDRNGRYAYGNQPTIAHWNLSRLAETLIDLVNPNDSDDAINKLTIEVNAFPEHYQKAWLSGMRAKLGLVTKDGGDLDLANDFHTTMEGAGVDFTQAFRALSDVVRGDMTLLRALFTDPHTGMDAWLERYKTRQTHEPNDAQIRADAMDKSNPIYIPRNHMVEAALKAASSGDMAPFDALLDVLAQPFTAQDNAEIFATPAPIGSGPYKTFCGT